MSQTINTVDKKSQTRSVSHVEGVNKTRLERDGVDVGLGRCRWTLCSGVKDAEAVARSLLGGPGMRPLYNYSRAL